MTCACSTHRSAASWAAAITKSVTVRPSSSAALFSSVRKSGVIRASSRAVLLMRLLYGATPHVVNRFAAPARADIAAGGVAEAWSAFDSRSCGFAQRGRRGPRSSQNSIPSPGEATTRPGRRSRSRLESGSLPIARRPRNAGLSRRPKVPIKARPAHAKSSSRGAKRRGDPGVVGRRPYVHLDRVSSRAMTVMSPLGRAMLRPQKKPLLRTKSSLLSAKKSPVKRAKIPC
jgi:hypothetical protein